MWINKYNQFLTNASLENFDRHIISELKRLGITDHDLLRKTVKDVHRGNLAKYLHDNGMTFTFGILHAIFKDAIEAKRKTDISTGVLKMAHRLIPILMAPYYPLMATIGYILGTSRAFNKVIAPILSDPGTDYPAFIKKIIDGTMRVAEGDLSTKDRFSRAFVVSDKLIDAIKPDVLFEFSLKLSDEISKIDPDLEVPENFIENELKSYINNKFDIKPKIPLNEGYIKKFSDF